MNRLKFLFAAFVVAVLTLGVYSCAKDNDRIPTQKDTTLQWRSTMPEISTINGMLNFGSYQDFESTLDLLKSQEQDTLILKSAYLELGVNLDEDDEITENLTDYPVCRLFEDNHVGYLSQRRYEENLINEDLNAGGDTWAIIEDPYFKTLVNTYNTVKIGSRIFKYFDNGGVAIILNNNWELYDSLKTTTYETLVSQQDLFVTNWDKKNWTSIYTFTQDNKIDGEKEFDLEFEDEEDVQEHPACKLDTNRINIVHLDDGTMRLELLGHGPNNASWSFSNKIETYEGNPVIVPCDGSGRICVTIPVDFWPFICVGCKHYECPNSETCALALGRINRELIRTINGQTWRIQASLWLNRGEIGCSNSYRRRRFGIWVPASNDGVRTDVRGTYYRTNDCLVTFGSASKSLGKGTYPPSISATFNDIPEIGVNGGLTSGHTVNVKGTWFGFGITVPRLEL